MDAQAAYWQLEKEKLIRPYHYIYTWRTHSRGSTPPGDIVCGCEPVFRRRRYDFFFFLQLRFLFIIVIRGDRYRWKGGENSAAIDRLQQQQHTDVDESSDEKRMPRRRCAKYAPALHQARRARCSWRMHRIEQGGRAWLGSPCIRVDETLERDQRCSALGRLRRRSGAAARRLVRVCLSLSFQSGGTARQRGRLALSALAPPLSDAYAKPCKQQEARARRVEYLLYIYNREPANPCVGARRSSSSKTSTTEGAGDDVETRTRRWWCCSLQQLSSSPTTTTRRWRLRPRRLLLSWSSSSSSTTKKSTKTSPVAGLTAVAAGLKHPSAAQRRPPRKHGVHVHSHARVPRLPTNGPAVDREQRRQDHQHVLEHNQLHVSL
ncbi:unnamed protein product [Trichogramma brassicae]|uniref:Uncharacterized protein n=1 Tax=Trichogramma brassicae TaxID=86971 RepID=A0A6H5INC4_9HYME|nr:unnamed protein product [Trichogramma brassicae]